MYNVKLTYKAPATACHMSADVALFLALHICRDPHKASSSVVDMSAAKRKVQLVQNAFKSVLSALLRPDYTLLMY